MKIEQNISMAPRSNMKIGGIGRALYSPETIEELTTILPDLKRPFLLGNGTNILFKDHFLDYDFITLKKIQKIDQIDQHTLFAPAGITLDQFLACLRAKNLGGYEKIAGIPGTLGGLIFMNGGAYGTTISDHLLSVTCCDLNGNVKEIPKSELNFSYRTSPFQDRTKIILGATFQLQPGYDHHVEAEIREKRGGNHPLEYPNLGSTFRNPPGYYAVKLIIGAGLRGYRIGNATFSTKHANFITNLGGATFNDVISLIEEAQRRVLEQFDVKLEREILIIQ